jgi:hypothetical protein
MTYSFAARRIANAAGTAGSPGFSGHCNTNRTRLPRCKLAERVRAVSICGTARSEAVLFRLKRSDRLLLVIHLVVDGVWRILLKTCGEDTARAYRAGPSVRAEDRFLPTVGGGCSGSPAAMVLADRAYWSSVLGRTPTPPDTDDGGPTAGDSETVHTALSPDETLLLLTESHQAYDTEVNDLLLTALGRALPTRLGNRQALITLEGHGRERLDVELDLSRTVGWFTCWHPFLLPTGQGDLGEQIRQVRQALRGVPKRGLSYGILRYLTPPHLASSVRAPCRPQLSFNYLGQFDGGDGSGLDFAPESSGRAISPRLTRLHDLDVIGIVTAGGCRCLSHSTQKPPPEIGAGVARRLSLPTAARGQAPAIRPRSPRARIHVFTTPADDIDHILQSFSDES